MLLQFAETLRNCISNYRRAYNLFWVSTATKSLWSSVKSFSDLYKLTQALLVFPVVFVSGLHWARGAIGPIDPLKKTWESNFIHRDFVQFGKQHSRLSPFCRPLFYHSSVMKCIHHLKQWRRRCEAWLPNTVLLKSPP